MTNLRVGHGYDVHRLTEGRQLILGGVDVPYDRGLLGHSDADVLTHAVMDALLGAAALGDIGKLFPDSDDRYAGADSVELLRRVTRDIPNVEIEHSDELLADYARRKQCGVVVKGLRAVSDFEHEFQMALINHQLNPELDTMFLTSEHQFMFLSSSIVKEMGHYGADLREFLPEQIIDDFRSRLAELNER